jgi:hypothetical protein
MSAVRFSLKGTKTMAAKLRAMAENQHKRGSTSLFRRAQAILKRSREEFVPVDEGDLRDSGYVKLFRDTRERTTIQIGFSALHAVPVHEHLSEHSPYSWRTAEARGSPVRFHPDGRGPKFLEIPFLEAQATLKRDLAQDLQLKDLK